MEINEISVNTRSFPPVLHLILAHGIFPEQSLESLLSYVGGHTHAVGHIDLAFDVQVAVRLLIAADFFQIPSLVSAVSEAFLDRIAMYSFHRMCAFERFTATLYNLGDIGDLPGAVIAVFDQAFSSYQIADQLNKAGTIQHLKRTLEAGSVRTIVKNLDAQETCRTPSCSNLIRISLELGMGAELYCEGGHYAGTIGGSIWVQERP